LPPRAVLKNHSKSQKNRKMENPIVLDLKPVKLPPRAVLKNHSKSQKNRKMENPIVLDLK
jgi:hypothetical protein